MRIDRRVLVKYDDAFVKLHYTCPSKNSPVQKDVSEFELSFYENMSRELSAIVDCDCGERHIVPFAGDEF